MVDTEGGSYSGTVCGNRCIYSGGGAGWTESGLFVLSSDGSATKTSDYSSAGEFRTGHCDDTLESVLR